MILFLNFVSELCLSFWNSVWISFSVSFISVSCITSFLPFETFSYIQKYWHPNERWKYTAYKTYYIYSTCKLSLLPSTEDTSVELQSVSPHKHGIREVFCISGPVSFPEECRHVQMQSIHFHITDKGWWQGGGGHLFIYFTGMAWVYSCP